MKFKFLPKTGTSAFRILLAGQAVSLLGTGMSRFAVMIWAYQQTGTALSLALLGFFSCVTYVIASPFAGVLIDRLDRRKIMFLSDLGAGLTTLLLLCLFAAGRLELWHLYLAQGIAGAFEAFQEPAFSASVSLLVPRHTYTRSNAQLGLGKSAARMLAPAFAGGLLPLAGLGAILSIDLLTMTLALLGLVLIRIPAPPPSSESRQAAGTFFHQMGYGFRYLRQRPGLLGVLGTYFLINFFGTLTYFAVLSPMILARTGGDEFVLGMVRLAMGVGGIAGGLLVTVWGGSKHKVRTFLLATIFSFLLCDFLMGVSRTLPGWVAAGFLAELSIAFIVSPYYAFWQEVVPPGVQGKVFATRDMVRVIAQPIGYLAGGIMADGIFEPAMMAGGGLAPLLGSLVGTGPGAGMGAMFLLTCLLGALSGLLGLLSPTVCALDGVESPAQVQQPVMEQ
jgi:MFS transporter, DHA3 family, macrolide efflux protein